MSYVMHDQEPPTSTSDILHELHVKVDQMSNAVMARYRQTQDINYHAAAVRLQTASTALVLVSEDLAEYDREHMSGQL